MNKNRINKLKFYRFRVQWLNIRRNLWGKLQLRCRLSLNMHRLI